MKQLSSNQYMGEPRLKIERTSHVCIASKIIRPLQIAEKDVIPASGHALLGRSIPTSSRPSIPGEDTIKVSCTIYRSTRILLIGDSIQVSMSCLSNRLPIEVVANESTGNSAAFVLHLCCGVSITSDKVLNLLEILIPPVREVERDENFEVQFFSSLIGISNLLWGVEVYSCRCTVESESINTGRLGKGDIFFPVLDFVIWNNTDLSTNQQLLQEHSLYTHHKVSNDCFCSSLDRMISLGDSIRGRSLNEN